MNMETASEPQRGSPAAIALEASRQASGAAHAADHADRWALEITRLAQERPSDGLGVVVPVALRAAEVAERSAMVAAEARRRARALIDDQGDRTRAAWMNALRVQARVASRARTSAEAAADEAAAAVAAISQAA
jgi:hypothetical protein